MSLLKPYPRRQDKGLENTPNTVLLVPINLKKSIEDKEDKKGDLRVSFFMINNLYLPLFHACRKDQ